MITTTTVNATAAIAIRVRIRFPYPCKVLTYVDVLLLSSKKKGSNTSLMQLLIAYAKKYGIGGCPFGRGCNATRTCKSGTLQPPKGLYPKVTCRSAHHRAAFHFV